MDGHVPPGRVLQSRGVRSLATRARVVRAKRGQHVGRNMSRATTESLALRNDKWVPSIRACRSVYDNTTVRDILEPTTQALPNRGGVALRRERFMHVYWNSLLGALMQAPNRTAAHADTSQLKSDSTKGC